MERFSETGEPEHYFNTKDTIKLIKKTSRKIIGKIAEFLFELSLKSSDKEVKDNDDLDSNEKNSDEKNLDKKNSDEECSDEESKVFTDQTPFLNDEYEISLHLFTFSNNLAHKVEFLQNLIWSLYRNLN